MLSPEWVAGFFDGEGSVGVYARSSGTYHMKVQVSQARTEEGAAVLAELRARFGGGLSAAPSRMAVSAMAWQLSGEQAVHFLREIRPHLVAKARQVDEVLAWHASSCPCPTRGPRGRMLPSCEHRRTRGAEACERLKAMKRERLA